MHKRPMRIRYTARFKCLVCYMIAFALPLLWQAAGLVFVYPYKLASTAPDIAAQLSPHLSLPVQPAAATFREAAAAQESLWLTCAALWFAACWLLALLLQLLWRCTHRSPLLSSRRVQRAVVDFRLMMLAAWALAAAFAAALWYFGVQHIVGQTQWDWLVYFGGYALIPMAVWITSRLAAPPVISGKHGFFKRL